MAGRDEIHSIRITIRTAGSDGEYRRQGSHYDLMLKEGSIPEMSDEFIASLFAETARDTVMYELTGKNPSAGLTKRSN